MQFDFEKYTVCHVAGPKDSYYDLALHPGYQPGFEGRPGYEPLVGFWTLSEGAGRRILEVQAVLEDHPKRFVFTDTQGRTFKLRPLTPELYRRHIRKTLSRPFELPTYKAIKNFFHHGLLPDGTQLPGWD